MNYIWDALQLSVLRSSDQVKITLTVKAFGFTTFTFFTAFNTYVVIQY